MKDDDTRKTPPIAGSESTLSRRELLRAGGLLAVGGLGGGVLDAGASEASPQACQVRLVPKYFPMAGFVPEEDITGKFAVITGASRGIGRAVAEELVSLGVTVIGTSRDVAAVPNPPTDFELLDLDVTSDASVDAFVAALLAHPDYPGQVDILINNAGRFVIGTIVPPPLAPDPSGFFLSQTQLGYDTNYLGQIRVTQRLMPYMSTGAYSRLIYTTSVEAYRVGGADAGFAGGDPYFNVYTSAKRALLAYANSLRGHLRNTGSTIQVSTVSPYGVKTGLAEGLNPVYTEPVDNDGNAIANPDFQLVLTATRLFLQNALPPAFAARAFSQLLRLSEPDPNVTAGSGREPWASKGGTVVVNSGLVAENQESAMRFLATDAPPAG